MRFLLPGLVVGLLLRLVWLADLPPGFTPDEAAFGYNAYSLLQTGRDEWSRPFFTLPFTNLKSFGDDKLPLYVFLTAPSIAILGLTEFATRLPNALIGSLGVVTIFLLAQTVLGKKYRAAGYLCAWMFALSPWSVQLSRGGFEANLVTTFLPLTLTLLLRHRPAPAALFTALTIYSYHTPRLLTLPIALFTWFVFRFRGLKKFLLLTALFVLPTLAGQLFSGNARLADVTLFRPTDNWHSVADRQFEAQIAGLPVTVSRFFANKPLSLAGNFLQNYLSYFSPQFFILDGPGEFSYGMIAGRGVVYFIDVIFLVVWLVVTLRHPRRPQVWLAGLLLLAPLAAALTKGPGLAANRAALMLPFVILAAGAGASFLLQLTAYPRRVVIGITALVYLGCTLFFVEDYVFHGYKPMARSMLYGYRETLSRALVIGRDRDHILVSRGLSEPHIYVAFYTRYNPRAYQQVARSWPDFQRLGYSFLDQLDGYRLGNFTFGSVNLDRLPPGTLIIAKPEELPPDYPRYFTLDYPDGSGAVTVTQN